MTATSTALRTAPSVSFTFTIHTPEFRNLPIPGVEIAKVGDCFVRVTDLPEKLDHFMKVNPRVPKRTQKGVLTGPVIKGIFETLREQPENMSIKNQGIYLLVKSADFVKATGGQGQLTLVMEDPERHGVVNGGHTYAAIRDAMESADDDEIETIKRAFVRLHILQGIDTEQVSEIAEGLNRSKQVDDPSLANLQGFFSEIRKVMKGKLGEKAIAYHQGDEGEVYIPEVLVYMQLFNCERFSDDKHPFQLYRKPSSGLKYYEQDLARRERREPAAIDLLVPQLPELLALADRIRRDTPESAKRNGFEFGRMKIDRRGRAASKRHSNTPLPFIDDTTKYRVPKGWLFPMLAAFRANVRWDMVGGKFEWIVPPTTLLDEVIDSMVNVCVSEHRDNNLPPEAVGKRESSYRQCYDKILLHLARRGLLGDQQ